MYHRQYLGTNSEKNEYQQEVKCSNLRCRCCLDWACFA